MPEKSTPSPLADGLREAVAAGFPLAVADLSRLVRIPSVSWDGFDHAHVEASAEAVRALAADTGVFDEIEVVRVPYGVDGKLGLPAVIATRAARNGRPTIMLYAHHDVQPEGEPESWDSTPYEPTLRGDRLYGRGAADDKAGVMAHIGAIRALVAAGGDDLDVGLVLFVEGEEEFGSRSLHEILHRYRDRLASAVIVVADSGNWDLETPALTIALRGAVAFNLRITTLAHASHSGMMGGAVPDAPMVAIRLLSTLWNADGSVAVAGLTSHDEATPAYDEAKLREESGLLDGVAPIGSGDILSRTWYQPSITVTGMDIPSIRNASNTLVPSVRVRISARVAPGQTWQEASAAIEAHLRSHVPFGAEIAIEDLDTGNPFLVDASGWAAADALATMSEAYGREAVEIGAGGSIPFIADLVELFPGAQILITGVEDPDSRAHSPNESVHLPTFQRAILSEALLLSRLDARALEPAGDPASQSGG
ncbi:dipeptidase [Pseudolysinimonas sp.]|jgi:acetylornithine deacetylase/succinyl-diaminopimelate desuccinylase-like protein|uniref:dipeptidase n=1 Tax=Pseudolysinimonas sp. TaxID=2680009 RepID=UPI0037832C98